LTYGALSAVIQSMCFSRNATRLAVVTMPGSEDEYNTAKLEAAFELLVTPTRLDQLRKRIDQIKAGSRRRCVGAPV
jgi:hypothetical protein